MKNYIDSQEHWEDSVNADYDYIEAMEKEQVDNRFNFVRWYQAESSFLVDGFVGVGVDNTGIQSLIDFDCCYPINEIPNDSIGVKRGHSISFYKNDECCWIMNFDPQFLGENESNINVSIVNQQWQIVSNLGNLQKSGSSYYKEFFVPSLPNEIYNGRFVIYNSISNVVYYFSNTIKILSASKSKKKPFFKIRHSSDLYGYKFKTDLQGVYIKLRLDAQERYRDALINLSQVKERTTGKTRNQLSLADQLVIIKTKRFDKHSNEAMIPVSIMDDQEINGKKYVIRTPYKWQGNELTSLSDGVIEYTDEEASTINVGG